MLDSMTEDQFIWEPYSDELIEILPDYCRIERDIWRARVPIFCWDVVEIHLANRVMRQFGLKQTIPTPFSFDFTHFHYDRRKSRIQIGSWSMHNGCLFETNGFKIFVMYQSITNHYGMMTPTLFGSDALLSLLLVILLRVLSNKKVMYLTQRHMKQWCVIFIQWLIKQNHSDRIESNELDDFNDELDGNKSEDASEDGNTTIRDGEPSTKEKHTIIPKHCGTGSHYVYQHAKRKQASRHGGKMN